MKKLLFAIIAICCLSAQQVQAQRYNAHRSSRENISNMKKDSYFGFRIGPTFSAINSGIDALEAGNRTGLNMGIAAGFGLTRDNTLYLETGLSYTEKGGKDDKPIDVSKTLDYFEVPLVAKYFYAIDDKFTVQPFLGVYGGLAIAGKVKTKINNVNTSESSFDNDALKAVGDNHHYGRLDAGLRIGCGASFEMFYVELAYDLGLANIGSDDFETAHNSALQLNFGVNF